MLLGGPSFIWRPRELSCWLKKVTYFGQFGYLVSLCIRKSIILMISRDKFTLLEPDSVICFCWFPASIVGVHADGLQLGVSLQVSLNLSKTFLRISCIRKLAVTWILVRGFAYLPSFLSQILDFIYWTVLIFISICFEWRDTKSRQLFENHSPSACDLQILLVFYQHLAWFTSL